MFAGKMWDATALISTIGSHAMRRFWCSASRLFVAAKHLFNISIFSCSTYLGDPASRLAPDSTRASQFLRSQSQAAINAEKGAVLRLHRQRRRYEKSAAHSSRTNDGDFADR